VQGGLLRTPYWKYVVSEIRGWPLSFLTFPLEAGLAALDTGCAERPIRIRGAGDGNARHCAALSSTSRRRSSFRLPKLHPNTAPQQAEMQADGGKPRPLVPLVDSSFPSAYSRAGALAITYLGPSLGPHTRRVPDQSAASRRIHILGYGMGLAHQVVRCSRDRVPFDPPLEFMLWLICSWQPDCVAGTTWSWAVTHWSASRPESGTPYRRFWFLGLAYVFRCCDRAEEG
jgi:hypothetical protein